MHISWLFEACLAAWRANWRCCFVRTMVEPRVAVARRRWVAARRDLFDVVGERWRASREERRAGTRWCDGCVGERMMRRVLRMERMARSCCRRDGAGLERAREGDWKIWRALDRFPVPC